MMNVPMSHEALTKRNPMLKVLNVFFLQVGVLTLFHISAISSLASNNVTTYFGNVLF